MTPQQSGQRSRSIAGPADRRRCGVGPRAQAADAKTVAELSVVNTKRQVALAAADAFLTIIGARRVVESNVSARDVAKAHFDLATELERAGRGSRLNALRAQQQYSIDEGLVETSLLAVYRAQEALGVLLAEDGPVDAADEPTLEAARRRQRCRDPGVLMLRSDLKLFAAREQLAAKIVRDSSKDWWPSVDAIFQPTTLYPSQFFLPQNSWRLLLQANVPIFDSGQRGATRTLREADLARNAGDASRVRAPKPAQSADGARSGGEHRAQVWPAPEPRRARRTRLSTSPASASAPAAPPTSRSSTPSAVRATPTWPS